MSFGKTYGPTGGSNMQNAASAYFSNKQKQEQETPYQQNLSQPEPAQKWYAGEKPTRREYVGKIMSLYGEGDPKYQEALNYYRTSQATPGTDWYQPYTQVTNSAVASLEALGVDTTGIDTDEWFTQNAYMQNWFTSNDGSNEVKKPGKGATAEEWAGYYYRQAYKQKDLTNKSRTEWDALQQELTYKTQNPYRNSTDQEIIDSIDWSKYPTLVAMDNGRDAGVPLELNAKSDYCRDALEGVIWAARNPNGQGGYGTGNTELNMAYSAMGIGNQYQPNQELRDKLDPVNPAYSPYSVGPAGNDANALCLYFGVYELTPQWVKENENLLNSTDATKKNNYIKAANIVSYTEGLNNSLQIMNDSIDHLLDQGCDADTVIRKVFEDGYVAPGLDPTGEVDYKDLFALDDTMTGDKNRGKLKDTGYAIDYKRAEMEARIRQKQEELERKKTEYVQAETGTDAKDFQRGQKNLGKTSGAIVDYGSESDRRVLKCGIHGPIAAELMTGKANAVPNPEKLHEAGKKTLDNLALATWQNARNADNIEKAQANIDEMNAANVALGVESRFNNMMDAMGVDQEKREDYREMLDQMGNTEAFNAIRNNWDQAEFMRTITPESYANGTDVYSDTRLNFQGLSSEAAMDAADAVGEINETLAYLSDNPEDTRALLELYSEYMDLQGYISGEGEYYPEAGQDALIDMFMGRYDGENGEDELEKARMLRDVLMADKTAADEVLRLGNASYYLEGAEKQKQNDAEIAYNEQAIADFEDQMAQYVRQLKQAPMAVSMYEQDGTKYSGDTMNMVGDIYDIVNSDLPPKEWDSYSVFDLMERAYNDSNGAEGMSRKDVTSYARYIATNNPVEIRRIQETVKFLQDQGFVFPEIDMQKINRKIEDLTTEARQASYYLLDDMENFRDTVDETKAAAANNAYGKTARWMTDGKNYHDIEEWFETFVDVKTNGASKTYTKTDIYNALEKQDIDRYFYILGTDGKDAANKYLQDLVNSDNGIITTRRDEKKKQEAYEFASQNGWTALLATAGSLVTKVPAAINEFVYRKAMEIQGKEINPHAEAYMWSTLTGSLREGSKERFATDVSNLLSGINSETFSKENVQKVTDFLYDMAISGAADSAINGLITSAGLGVIADMVPFGSKIGQAIAYIEGGGMGSLASGALKITSDFIHAAPMGLGAAESAYRDAVLKGATPEQAEKMATMTFFAETLSEAITFSNMKGMLEAGQTKEVKAVIMELLGDSLEEAFGEGMNELVEQHFDREIMGAESEWAANYQSYIEAGYSPTMASEMADREMWNGVMKAALSGAMSSWLTGGVSYFAGRHGNTSLGRAVTSRGLGTVTELIRAGLSDSTDISTFDLASQLGRDLAEGNKLSRNKVGQLTKALMSSSNESVRAMVDNALNNRNLGVRSEAVPVDETEAPDWYDQSKELAMLLEASSDTGNTGAGVTNIGAVLAGQGFNSGLSTSEALATAQTMVTKVAGGDTQAAAQTMSGLIQNAAETVAKRTAPAAETAQAAADININDIEKLPTKDRTLDQQLALEKANEASFVKEYGETYSYSEDQMVENAAKRIAVARALDEGLDSSTNEYQQRVREITTELLTEATDTVNLNTETVGNDVAEANDMADAAERVAQTKRDVSFATMTDGAANAALTGIVESVKAGNDITAEDVRLLHDAVLADQEGENGAAMQESYAKAVMDNRISNRITEKMSTDEVTKEFEDEDKKVEQARVNLDAAQKAFDEAVAKAQTASQNVAALANEDLGKTDMNQVVQNAIGQQQSALNEQEAAKSQLEVQQQKNTDVQKEAEENKSRIFDRIYDEARAEVTQEMAQEQEAARQAQEQQRANYAKAIAQRVQRQAEADELSGKTAEERQDAIIEKILDAENITGEERDKRREELKDQRDKVKFSKVNMSGPVNNTEGMLTIAALSRKIGVDIDFKKMPFAVRGQYKDGKIWLNENRIVKGSMSIGQALVEAALHEIPHAMANTNAYQTYRGVVLGSLFGIDNAGDAQTLYNTNADFRAAIDNVLQERQEGVTGEDLSIEEAEEEIIADFARTRLNTKDVIQRFADTGTLWNMRSALHNINQALKNFFGVNASKAVDQQNAEIRKWNEEHPDKQRELVTKADYLQQAEYLRKAERAYQKAMFELAKSEVHPEAEKFSVQQMARATGIGMVADDESLKLYMPDSRGTIIGDGTNGMQKGVRYVEVDGVNHRITPEMIVNTPVGMLIDMGLSDKVFKGNDGQLHSQKGDARKMFADLMNLCARYKDNNLVWEIAGSEFSESFSALKSNSDPQYKTTVDFGTICAKTQAIVDVLSKTMVDRAARMRAWNEAHSKEIAEGKEKELVFTGLKREDIMDVYNETHKAKLSVPCPVCYVFSRWMGVPSLLGQMNRFQHEYVVTQKDENGKTLYDENGDAIIDMEATKAKANNYIKSMLDKYGDKDAIAKKKTSLNNRYKTHVEGLPKLNEARMELERQLKQEGLTDSQRKKIQEKIEKNKKAIEKNVRETDEIMEEMREVEGFNWVTQALCLQAREGNSVYNVLDENGDYVIDEAFRLTPEDILFDLNRTGEFAGYIKNWKYRTTRGAGMGKAIMPYSGASIGDIINGEATRWQMEQNPFENMRYDEAKKAFDRAKERVRKQNLVGGQRFQSTSDFRPEWGLDYIMSFLEMQALGSKVQMYTKVAEAVDFIGSIGADGNESIMPSGNGYHIATDAELKLAEQDTEEGKELRSRMGVTTDENGVEHTYVMDFSDVTGMDYNIAKGKSKKFNSIQMILVGINDIHIRLALGNEDIDFVIPWHSSGNSKDVLRQLVASVGETLSNSTDYTDTQTDRIKSHKEGKGKKEKTIDDRSEMEIARWNARMKILTGVANKAVNEEKPNEGGFGTITFADGTTMSERELVYNDPWLKQLYDRFYVEGVDPDCYGVALPTAQAEQIFPYEYWDKTSTRENADVNGQRFAEYCDRLGLVPRFSQFKDVSGYWKLLIDRKMYDNNTYNEDGTIKEYGKYREQQVVDVTKARIDDDASQELDAQEQRKRQVYQLPESIKAAKYGKNYSAETEYAVNEVNALLDKKYDVRGRYSAYGDLTEADVALEQAADEDYMRAVENGDTETADRLVDEKAKRNGLKIFDEEFPTLKSLYEGVKDGRLLIHARRMAPEEAENMEWLEPEWGETLQGTEAAGWYEENGYEPPNLIFASDGTTWSGDERNGIVFVRRDNFQQSNGDGTVNLPDGTTVPYELSPLADYESDVLREEPPGVESGDWYTNQDTEVVAAMPFYAKSADTVTYDDDGNIIPLSERFNRETEDARYSTEGETTDADAELARQYELNQQLVRNGVITQEELEEYQRTVAGRPLEGETPTATTSTGQAERQFNIKMLQNSDEIDAEAKRFAKVLSGRGIDTNADQLARAVKWIRSNRESQTSDGLYESLQQIASDNFDYRSADGQARMIALMALAAAKNDTFTQVALTDAFGRQGTDLGRALQARKLFLLMTPEGRAKSLEKMLKNTQEQLWMDGKVVDLKLSDWVYRAARAADDPEMMKKVQKAAAREIGSQIPATLKDKLNGWRMLAMLGNPRTHVRNIIGNALFMPAVGIKNKLGALAELAMDKDKRTKTLGFADQEARAFAKEDADKIRDTLTGEAKYEGANLAEQNRKIWGQGNGIISKTLGKGLQALSDFNSWALEGEDWLFLRRHYRNALAGYMTARGLKAADMTGKTLEDARAYAVQEAQKATYRDANAVASWLNGIKNPVGKFMVNAVVPFKKTPANILRRGVEYSPAGLIKSLTYDLVKLHQYNEYQKGNLKALPKGAISPTQWVDKMTSGLTGTAISALGFALASLGYIKVGLKDKDDEFDKLYGSQEYSLEFKIGDQDVSYTLDWAAPSSMPFFVGAMAYEMAGGDENEDLSVTDAISSILSVTEPVWNLSMLDGVNRLMSSAKYSGDNPMEQLALGVLANYGTSYIPTLFGQVARTIDTTRRKNYVPSGSNVIDQVFGSAIEQIENKLPFLSKGNIPYRNAWGEEETSNQAWAAFENLISPGYGNIVKRDAITTELERLYHSTTIDDDDRNTMVPKLPQKTLMQTKENGGETIRLTDQQYDQYVVERGQTAKNLIGELMQTPEYIYADDGTKADMVSDLWTYSNQRAGYIVSDGTTDRDKWVEDAEKKGDPVNAVIDRAIDRNVSEYRTEYKTKMFESIDDGDIEAANTCLEALRRSGMEDKNIKAAVTKYYKPLYQDALKHNDPEHTAIAFGIEEELMALDGLKYNGKTFSSWSKGIDEEEDEEEEEAPRDITWMNTENW